MNFDLNLPMEEEKEQDNTNPHDITSFDINKVLQANIIYLKKKRKFQAEKTDLPLLKHKFRDRNLNSDSDSPSAKTLLENNYEIYKLEGKTVSETSNNESVKDSNSTDLGNMDYSSETVSNEVNTVSNISISTSDISATLSVGNGSFTSDPYSLESKSKSPRNTGDCSYSNNDFGLNTCMDYDESLLEFGCDSVENGSCDTEQYKEDMLYSNGMPSNYVLSSGKWSFIQEKKGGTKKPTIDKEFEEYFSMLML